MRKKIIFILLSFFFILSLSGLAGAAPDFKDTVENYPNGVFTDTWTQSIYVSTSGGGSVSIVQNPLTTTHSLQFYSMVRYNHAYYSYAAVTSKDMPFSTYFSFNVRSLTYGSGDWASIFSSRIQLLNEAGTVCGQYDITSAGVYELVATGSEVYIYKNGVSVTYIQNGNYNAGANYNIKIGSYTQSVYSAYTDYINALSTTVIIDDFSTGSCVGIAPEWNEFQTTLSATYLIQGLAQHPNYNYTLNINCLSGETTGLINTTILSTASPAGLISYNIPSVLGENYGLYSISLKRDEIELDGSYFVYYLSTDPISYPEILFLAGSDIETEIRDDNNNGGTISGGGSVYLYPEINENGIYNFSYNILESASSMEATLSTVYNTTPINQTNFSFSGLSSTNYYVSVDNVEIMGTNLSDTWEYQLPWNSINPHIINFEPNYYIPGVWGYIKNSETQNPIKSATVTVTNGSFTEYLFTDSNGMYYLTKGMTNGSYAVTASKTGYSTSVPYNLTTQEGLTTRKDIFLDQSSGSGVYYAPHDVTFTVLEYWYSSVGLPGVSYAVYDNENESVKNGTTGSKGTFTAKDMDAGKNYTFILTYNNQTYTEYLEPGLTEYNLVLNKEGIVHQYYNSWLNLTYAETSNNATILYASNKTVSAASLSVTASNGTIVQSGTLNTTSGTFSFNFTEGDYILQFNIEASDGSTASQAWSVSSPPEVTLFPASYPTWLKNTLFVAIIIIFLLAFGKSKNDIACGAVAVLTSLGYYFEWLSCGFNFVVLIWIIALGAIFLHYKRTGAVG